MHVVLCIERGVLDWMRFQKRLALMGALPNRDPLVVSSFPTSSYVCTVNRKVWLSKASIFIVLGKGVAVSGSNAWSSLAMVSEK